jgi:hypothetical protein
MFERKKSLVTLGSDSSTYVVKIIQPAYPQKIIQPAIVWFPLVLLLLVFI